MVKIKVSKQESIEKETLENVKVKYGYASIEGKALICPVCKSIILLENE